MYFNHICICFPSTFRFEMHLTLAFPLLKLHACGGQKQQRHNTCIIFG